MFKENDEYFPLYSRFQKLFSHLDKGYTYKTWGEIPAYNGGLFRNDELLDSNELIIDDEVLEKDSLILSAYDFNTEVDVNILGHIFEHSLNEIENITAQLQGEEIDKKKTKRKKDGIFYTPKYITKYIVENTVGTLCKEKKEEFQISNLLIDESLYNRRDNRRVNPSASRKPSATQKLNKNGKKLFKTLNDYKDWLLTLKILDPACGSGAFLNATLDFLIAKHKQTDNLIAELTGDALGLFDTDKAILENNIYGVDINEESVEIAKLSMWLRTAQKGRPLSDLSGNIKCGNSLIDDPEVAGDKAFDWNIEFKEIMDNGGFDVVIGNPPYAGRSSSINNLEKEYVKKVFTTSEGKFELYQLFIEKCTILVKPKKSLISLITPQTWLSIIQATKLRHLILSKKELSEIVFLGKDIFPDASVDSIIFILQKGENYNEIKFKQSQNLIKDNISTTKTTYSLIDINTKIIPINSNIEMFELISNIKKDTKILEEFGIWSDGVKVVGKAKSFAFQTQKVNKSFHPMLNGKNIGRYSLNWDGMYCCRDKSQIEEHIATDIRLRDEKMFIRPKILIRKTGNKIVSSIDLNNYYYEQSLFSYGLTSDDFDLLYIVSVLNSKLVDFLLKENAFSKKETFPQIRLHWLKELPIKIASKKVQLPLIEKAGLILSQNKDLQSKASKFIKRIKSNLEVEKITGKLHKFYDYDFKTFISELKKQKIKLTFKEQDDWEDYFEDYKKEINQVQTQISQTDKEIDKMVYELYELTEEEIGIVENS